MKRVLTCHDAQPSVFSVIYKNRGVVLSPFEMIKLFFFSLKKKTLSTNDTHANILEGKTATDTKHRLKMHFKKS